MKETRLGLFPVASLLEVVKSFAVFMFSWGPGVQHGMLFRNPSAAKRFYIKVSVLDEIYF